MAWQDGQGLDKRSRKEGRSRRWGRMRKGRGEGERQAPGAAGPRVAPRRGAAGVEADQGGGSR